MAKYSNWTQGNIEALINTLGEENARKLIQGEVEVQFRPCAIKHFDKNGRRIPPRGLTTAVCDPNPNFHLIQPKLDYAGRLERLMASGMDIAISAAEFEARSKAILEAVKTDEQIKNLLKGVHLPIIIPPTAIDVDLGLDTERLVKVAGSAYQAQFPGRQFINHHIDELTDQVSIVQGSRYKRLIETIERGPAVGIYSPVCLQGFSVHAQREQMQTLPDQFILSGPLDAAMGWVMYPDIFGSDFKTPGNDCSAVSWRSAGYSLGFGANDDSAGFGSNADLGRADGDYSGGLVLLG